MLETIYYLSTLFFLYEELMWLVKPKQKNKEYKEFSELSELNKDKKWKEYSKEFKESVGNRWIGLFFLLWMFFGLFTDQWVAFLIIFIFNVVVIAGIEKLLVKFSFNYVILHWINSLIGLIFGIFVIVNHYHLKIDLTKWFISLFHF